ncbi:Hypothetical protein POVR1_LOCUS514 [uncultured virus]|nr:Hypothetical protein POVR1_LOCUS514 [uncultured virus]
MREYLAIEEMDLKKLKSSTMNFKCEHLLHSIRLVEADDDSTSIPVLIVKYLFERIQPNDGHLCDIYNECERNLHLIDICVSWYGPKIIWWGNGEMFLDRSPLYKPTESYAKIYSLVMNHPKIAEALITIKDDEDLENHLIILKSRGGVQFLTPVREVYNPKTLIRRGLFPVILSDFICPDLLKFQDQLEAYMSEQYDDPANRPAFEFWCRIDYDQFEEHLKHFPMWKYQPLEISAHHAITECESFPLVFQQPDLLYRGSKRPITNMSIFRSPQSHTRRITEIKRLYKKIQGLDLIFYEVTIDGSTYQAIPVTRYASGMKSGLYHMDDEKSYLGTFYYYEPESTTLLAFRSFQSYFNKYDGIKKLTTDINDPTIKHLSQEWGHQAHLQGKLPRDLILTPREVFQHRQIEKGSNVSLIRDWTESEIDKLPQAPSYIGAFLYALEDSLDQFIAKEGMKHGLDIIILESMPGSHQIVTEILDVRSRSESFNHLIYLDQPS